MKERIASIWNAIRGSEKPENPAAPVEEQGGMAYLALRQRQQEQSDRMNILLRRAQDELLRAELHRARRSPLEDILEGKLKPRHEEDKECQQDREQGRGGRER